MWDIYVAQLIGGNILIYGKHDRNESFQMINDK